MGEMIIGTPIGERGEGGQRGRLNIEIERDKEESKERTPWLKAFLAALPRGVLILPAHYHPVVFTTKRYGVCRPP